MPQETMKCLYRFVVPQCVIQNEMRNEQFFSQFSVFWGWLVHMKCKTQGGGGKWLAVCLQLAGWPSGCRWMAVCRWVDGWPSADGCLGMDGCRLAADGWSSG